MANPTDLFHAFVANMKELSPRPEILLEEIPAPQRLAPFAYAVSADLTDPRLVSDDGELEDIATGRFVLLHDPEGQETWEGQFRCVTFVRSALETEMESDPLLPDVGWSWFMDALNNSESEYVAPSGTVTRVMSASYGQLSSSDESSEIEIRASWTPTNAAELMKHVNAWLDLMSSAAGLAPIPDGVSSLPRRR
ncbi:MAG: DUF3000 domain-containing protein [Actinomycetota bacterium]